MSEDQGPASGPAGMRERKRPGPTIDLQAEAGSGNPRDAGKPGWVSRIGAAMISPWRGLSSWWRHQVEQVGQRLPRNTPWHLIGAGGAVVGLALVLVLIVGLLGRDGGRNAVEARLARLEQQQREPATRPAVPVVDAKAIDALAGRVARLETGIAAPPQIVGDPALANRLATLEGEIRSIEEKLGTVGRRTDEVGAVARDAGERSNAVAAALSELAQKVARIAPATVEHSDVEALAARIAALEKSASAFELEMSKRTPAEIPDRAARLATLAVALDAAVARGEPFAVALIAVKQLGADAKPLAALEPFAASGVPSAAALAREILALLPGLAKSVGSTPRDGGILERFAANAEKLVRVRPIDEAPGDDPAAVLTRIELRAGQSDIAGVLAALNQLPPATRQFAAAWTAKAEARGAALSASRQLAADALSALGKGP